MTDTHQTERRDLDAFCQAVRGDAALQHLLRPITDEREFILLFVQAGADRGYHVREDDALAALRANRRDWLQRWIPQ
jgi:hypothetical protein